MLVKALLAGILVLQTASGARVDRKEALEIAQRCAEQTAKGQGVRGTRLRYELAKVEEGERVDNSRKRNVWLVYFPEQRADIEPSGLTVYIDKTDGSCGRAPME